MITLDSDRLLFSFLPLRAELEARTRAWLDAKLAAATESQKAHLAGPRDELDEEFLSLLPEFDAKVSFQRTLRIPDDGKDYALPPGLGHFPLRHVDDFPRVPDAWKKRGGVMMPMHVTEAMWLSFSSEYPMALKVGAGGICAVSGERWSATLHPRPQNYVVLPWQPWLDGFRVSEGVIRQFVAMPLGTGLTVEQQLTGEETWGGVQLQAFPMKPETYWSQTLRAKLERAWRSRGKPAEEYRYRGAKFSKCAAGAAAPAMGLGAGGRMKQEITSDPHGLDSWSTTITSRCFVHLCLAPDWRRLTGTRPPHRPPTAKDYTNAGLPWFDYHHGQPAVPGETALTHVKSVNTLVGEKTGLTLPDNEPVEPGHVVVLKPRVGGEVREF